MLRGLSCTFANYCGRTSPARFFKLRRALRQKVDRSKKREDDSQTCALNLYLAQNPCIADCLFHPPV